MLFLVIPENGLVISIDDIKASAFSVLCVHSLCTKVKIVWLWLLPCSAPFMLMNGRTGLDFSKLASVWAPLWPWENHR